MFVSDVFFGELLFKNDVKTAWSCVDFVLLMLFPHINNVFSYFETENEKLRKMDVYENGI